MDSNSSELRNDTNGLASLEDHHVETSDRSEMNSPENANTDGSATSKQLEESWISLDIFNHSHFGRIGPYRCSYSVDDGNAINADGTQSNGAMPETTEAEEMETQFLSDFVIPELPTGRALVINIKSTWGDPFYVGLNGIEVFTADGASADIAEISACPADVSILPEFANDPRKAANLIDGHFRTRDDVHLWLAPFSLGSDHLIELKFAAATKIAIIRVWNYNKSRIHSARGARFVEMSLDGDAIFKGEISQAAGTDDSDAQSLGDIILFTMDEDILEKIWQNDPETNWSGVCDDSGSDASNGLAVLPVIDCRPPTSGIDSYSDKNAAYGTDLSHSQSMVSLFSVEGDQIVVNGTEFRIELLTNWGDSSLIGLTGIEFLQNGNGRLATSSDKLSTIPATSNTSSLIDGSNVTTDESHMWCMPIDSLEGDRPVKLLPCSIVVRFSERVSVAELRIWNYNKSLEFSYIGVRYINLHVDDRLIIDRYQLRKAPGNALFDFSQSISFTKLCAHHNGCQQRVIIKQLLARADTTIDSGLPCGFVYQLQLLATWGDQFYIGLNGIELLDQNGKSIKLSFKCLHAIPESINVLPNVQNDVRTSAKLIDGCNATFDPCHMWLAPVFPNEINRIYIVFDQPQIVSQLKLWNYAKTPSRGTSQFVVLLDDIIIYSGQLPKSGLQEVATRTVRFSQQNCFNDLANKIPRSA